MAKKMKRIVTLILTLGFIIGSTAMSFADNSTTKIFNSDNSDKAPFDKQDIVVQIGDHTYDFGAQGSGTWTRDGVHELNLGENGSVPVIIIAEDGTRYEAILTNHSNYTGNDGNASPGTDTYDFSGIKQLGGEEPGGEEPGGEEPGGEEPGGEEPGGEEPGGEEPGGEEPGGEEPGGEEPGGEEPGGEEPGGEEPGGEEPGGEEPGGEEPGGSTPPSNPPYYPPYTPASHSGDDGLVDIFDEDVPLAGVPQTGDVTALWLALSALSGSGVAILNKKRKS